MEEKDFGKGIDQPLLSFIDNTYAPEVSHEQKPKVGQEFLSLDYVNDFYNRYAKEVGFNVGINSSKKNKETNVVVRMEYVCFKEKLVKKRDVGGLVREGCNAKLVVVWTKSGNYAVIIFVETHNHSLTTPSKMHPLRSHRNVSAAKKL